MRTRRASLYLLCSLGALLSAAGCEPAAGLCQSSNDCASRELCVAQRCRQACNSRSDCLPHEFCIEGACLWLASGDSGAVRDAGFADLRSRDTREFADGTVLTDTTAVDHSVYDRFRPDQSRPDLAQHDRVIADGTGADRRVLDAVSEDASADDRRVTDQGNRDMAPAVDASTPDVIAIIVDAGGAADSSSPDLSASLDAASNDLGSEDAFIGVDNAPADVATAVDTWVPDAVVNNPCGDRQVQVPETCDDGNLVDGDGCSANCAIEFGWSCIVDTSMGSVCREICGDGHIVGAEICDGDNHNGATCTSRGYLESTTSLVCGSDCLFFDTSLCGPAIVCSTLERAITEAYAAPGHEVLSIHPDTCNLNVPIVLNECASGSCPPAGPDGITLRSLGGDVIFNGAINQDCLLIETGHNVIEGLTFSDCDTGIYLDDLLANGGRNTVRHNRIINIATEPGIGMRVYSPSNTVLHNWIENQFHLDGNKGFSVRGDSNRLALNVVKGNYRTAISVKAQRVTVDSNTFWIEYTGAVNQGPVIKLDTATDLCFRDNMMIAPAAIPIYEIKVNVSFSSSSRCFPASSNNLVPNNGNPLCGGGFGLCLQHCGNGAPLCDVRPIAAPDIDVNACLKSGDPAIDEGRDLGYDRVENSSERFWGTYPDLGALESGASYRFGNLSFSCP